MQVNSLQECLKHRKFSVNIRSYLSPHFFAHQHKFILDFNVAENEKSALCLDW